LIGLAASGTGDIAPFNATNSNHSAITAKIVVTPVFKGNSGPSKTFTITVNTIHSKNTGSDQTNQITPAHGDGINSGAVMTESEIYAKYSKAVVCVLHDFSVTLYFANGDEKKYNWGCTGTAFFIDNNGTLLTNRHVACPWEYPDEDMLNVFLNESKKRKSEIVNYTGNTNYVGYALKDVDINPNRDQDFTECSIISHKSDDKDIDVALLRTKNRQLPTSDINPIYIKNAMCDQKQIVPGMNVYVMGYPLGIDLFEARSTGTTNTVQVKIVCQSGTINQEPSEVKFGINAQMTHGASGSPVLNKWGQLIGVYNSGVDVSGGGLNAAILAKHAKELYDKAN